ncbi:MMPL family transporter, partial [Bacillus safensis]
MRAIIKGRWLITILWVVLAAVLLITAPNMAQLTKEKGQISVPDGYPSSYANQLLKKMSENGDTEKSIVIVFQEKNIVKERETSLKKAMDILEKDQDLHIEDITSYFEANKDIKKQMLSKDQTTLLVPVTYDSNKIKASDFKERVNEKLKSLN